MQEGDLYNMLDKKKVKRCFVQGDVENNNVYLTSGLQPPTDADLIYRSEVSAYTQPFSSGGCYDEHTMVRTSMGWKYFKDLDGTEKFYTLDINSGKIELQSATKHFEYDVDGELLHFKSMMIDLMVTEDHNMVIFSNGYKLITASKVENKFKNGDHIFIPTNEPHPNTLKITDIKRVPYKGKVYCVEVPNHTLYVKRANIGVPVWCGNSIEHIFLGAKVSESLKKDIIDKLFDMPINYITLSPVLSVCNSCKTKVVGEHYVCPNCKDADHMMVYSRIIGYVRPIISGHICIENNMINGDENYWQDARRVDWVDRNKL